MVGRDLQQLGWVAQSMDLVQHVRPDPPSLRNASGSSISRRVRGSSQSKYSMSRSERDRTVLPARLTPASQTIGLRRHADSMRSTQSDETRPYAAQLSELCDHMLGRIAFGSGSCRLAVRTGVPAGGRASVSDPRPRAAKAELHARGTWTSRWIVLTLPAASISFRARGRISAALRGRLPSRMQRRREPAIALLFRPHAAAAPLGPRPPKSSTYSSAGP